MRKYIEIPLTKLLVNSANDRHGELADEASAIRWLLTEKTSKMKGLLEDIARRQGKIYEPPLVMKVAESDCYVVYDGNRRVSCLKLLHGVAPDGVESDSVLSDKIKALRSNSSIKFGSSVLCEVSDDLHEVNEILYLRHSPDNNGSERLKWDIKERDTFKERTGRRSKINLAIEIEKRLRSKGLLSETLKVPLSTLERLLSTPDIRRRLGLQKEKDSLKFLQDEEQVLGTMARVCEDLARDDINLTKVWSVQNKKEYLDGLERQGVLTLSSADGGDTSKIVRSSAGGVVPGVNKKKRVKSPIKSDRLLSSTLPVPEKGKFFSSFTCQLFHELQYELSLSRHYAAVSIAFRSLIETFTNVYVRAYGLQLSKTVLHEKIKCVHDEIKSQLPESTKACINKIGDEAGLFSVNTLHKITHCGFALPPRDLSAYASNLEPYLREIVLAVNRKQKDSEEK